MTPTDWRALPRWKRHKILHPESAVDSCLKRSFGITLKEYDRLFKKQGGVCKLCHKPEPGTRNGKQKRLAVDHDHATGRIRGLLCSRCNTALGLLNESIELLEAAVVYLKE